MPTALILSSHVASSQVGGTVQALALAAFRVDPVLAPTVLYGRHPGWGAPGGAAVPVEAFEGMLDGIEANGVIARTEAAVFKMINEQGGVGGRKINYISYDDGYSPPKTVDQVRRLVEEDQVSFIFATIGTPTNTAIARYTNSKHVPLIFLGSGANKWGDYKTAPWVMGWQPSYRTEAQIYTRPTHPYTQALLSAVPVPDPDARAWRDIIRLEGDVPSPADPPSGCRFRTRCWRPRERCATEEPPLAMRAADPHPSACHFAELRHAANRW